MLSVNQMKQVRARHHDAGSIALLPCPAWPRPTDSGKTRALPRASGRMPA